MIITISQAGPNDYNIDNYSTASRGGLVDNNRIIRKAGERSIKDLGLNKKYKWIKTTLPNSFINSLVIKYSTYFKSILDYKSRNAQDGNILSEIPIEGEQMFYGPGGNYLSNEIFYRVARMREELNPTLQSGHFHIAKLQNENINEEFNAANTLQLINIVKDAINNGVA